MKRRIILATLLTAYILFLFYLALFRFLATNPRPNLIPFHTMRNDWRVFGTGFVVNFLGNIVAFVPMGAVPPLIRKRRTGAWQVASFSLGLSLMIEVSQLASGRRVADVDDLILNTLGGLIGFWLVGTFRGAVGQPEEDPRGSRRPSDSNSSAAMHPDPLPREGD